MVWDPAPLFWFQGDYPFIRILLSASSLWLNYKGLFTHSMPCPFRSHAAPMPFPCRAHAVSLPCRAAKSLERVFPILFTHCGRVWFTLAMPCPCRAHVMLLPCRSRPRRETACGQSARVRLLPITTRSSTKIVIRSIPILLTTIHIYDCKEW